MYVKKSKQKFVGSSSLVKPSKKYIPTPEEANTIMIYFMHNNFQDFNTWQQISKSKCQFDYGEIKPNLFECKAMLKWDDSAMPVIVGIGSSRSKKNAKKKALKKLVENLIYLGFIGYGFKEYDFIRRLPKRMKESSDEESQLEMLQVDETIQPYIESSNLQQALQFITPQNFDLLLSAAIKYRKFEIVIKIFRQIQNNKNQDSLDITTEQKDQEIEQWQNSQVQLGDPFEKDLADVLKFQQSQPFQILEDPESKPINTVPIELPCQNLNSNAGTISFQSFNPIEYTFIFRRNLVEETRKKQTKRSDYFSDFYKQVPLPNFETQDEIQPLSQKIILKILVIFLEFSYDYNLIIKLLSIFERQVTVCRFDSNTQQENSDFFLKQMLMITAEFSFLLSRKCQMLLLSLEGLINVENDRSLTFVAKEPEQVLGQKIYKKVNTNEIQELQQFTNEQYVLLVSKLDPNLIFIGQLLQCHPIIKLKCFSFTFQSSQKQKLPFTMYKLSNAKLFNRLSKSITHVSKAKLSTVRANTFVIEEKPTYPILSVINQMLSQWSSLNETILLVSENFHEIYAFLLEKGFKIAKITQKAENIVKKNIVCCSPSGAASDIIKNHAFTRVLIEGAQRVSFAMSTLALDKGCKKIYLMGDKWLPSAVVLSKFSENRQMSRSLFDQLVGQTQVYNFYQKVEQHYFQISILSVLNKFFYQGQLNMEYSFESPSIKGFPWPNKMQRVCFIQIDDKRGNVQNKIKLTCEIVANVIKSGFIGVSEIGCRVLSSLMRGKLTLNLLKMFQKNLQLSTKPEMAEKLVDFATGYRFRQKSLSILICETEHLNIKHLISALHEGRRGTILLGNFKALRNNLEWFSVLKWANDNKLILKIQDQ